MLERDVLPNGRTYVNVIRALCLREKDVQSAVSQYEEERKWANYKSNALGLASDLNTNSVSAIEGYLSEGNFESAYNLFIGIKNIQTASAPDGFYRFLPPVYSYLLDSIASQVHPSSKADSQAMEIFNHASETDTASHRSLYRHLFRLLSALKDGSGVSALWDRFEQERVGGAGAKLREWKDVLPGSEVEEREIQVEGFQREVWLSAIRAFISTGNTSKGMELLGKMEERVGTNLKSTALLEAPRIKSDQYPTIAIALAQAGEYELSHQVYGKAGGKVRPLDIGLYTDALVLGGKWEMALDTYLSFLSTRSEEVRPDVTRIKRIYTSILAQAIAQSDVSVLENIERLMATGAYLLDTDLAIAHIKLLLSHGTYGSIAGVMDNFGPLQTKLDPEDRGRLNNLMQEIATTEISLKDMLDITKAFSRQRTNIMLEQQDLVRRIIDKYLSAGETVTSTLDPRQWSALLSTFSRTVGKGLNEGEYDHALESFIHDLKTYAPKTLENDLEGRYTRAIGERLFNRFGSEKAIKLLTPLIGVKADELIGSFFTPSTPELQPSSPTSGTSINSDTPLTPPPTTSTLRIDESLSRRIDSHQSRPDGKPHITPQRAYQDLLAALSRPTPSAPSPESLSRLMISLAREGDQSRVLELYDLAQRIIPTLPTRRQSSAWRAIEDSTLISQCHLGNLETAGLHRHRLVERGMGPSADAYATMIACSRDTTDDAQVARELWEESQAMGVVPHLYLYNTVISKLSKARKAEVALEMFAQMKERGVRPSSVTYGAVIVGPSLYFGHLHCFLGPLSHILVTSTATSSPCSLRFQLDLPKSFADPRTRAVESEMPSRPKHYSTKCRRSQTSVPVSHHTSESLYPSSP
jgi:pentatricopeptide repeat protein